MSAIKVANAPCSWGVLEFEGTAPGPGWPTVLSEMVGAGYVGTELGDWGFLPSEPDALRDALAAHSLELVGGFVPVALSNEDNHADGEVLAVRTARLMAGAADRAFVVLADDNGTHPDRTALAGRIRPERGLSDEAWRIFARGADRIARAVHDASGLRTVFHHHCAGFVETPAEVDRLLEMTDPGRLGLCLDMGHFTYGGGDARQALRRYGERVWHVHFKDCHAGVATAARDNGDDYLAAVRAGVFCELGKGTVDFAGIYADLVDRGYDGWIVVEQDVLPGMGAPEDSARRNREFLRGLGL